MNWFTSPFDKIFFLFITHVQFEKFLYFIIALLASFSILSSYFLA